MIGSVWRGWMIALNAALGLWRCGGKTIEFDVLKTTVQAPKDLFDDRSNMIGLA
jgi:hypothetical protein